LRGCALAFWFILVGIASEETRASRFQMEANPRYSCFNRPGSIGIAVEDLRLGIGDCHVSSYCRYLGIYIFAILYRCRNESICRATW
jgi:hypothetical protein